MSRYWEAPTLDRSSMRQPIGRGLGCLRKGLCLQTSTCGTQKAWRPSSWYFVKNLDESDRKFMEKLQEQLSSVPPSAKQLAAEMMWLDLLCPGRSHATTQTGNSELMWLVVWRAVSAGASLGIRRRVGGRWERWAGLQPEPMARVGVRYQLPAGLSAACGGGGNAPTRRRLGIRGVAKERTRLADAPVSSHVVVPTVSR